MRALTFVLLLLPLGALAQSQRGTYNYFRIGPSFGQPVLGSEDTRRGTVYALGYSRPEPRVSLRGLQGDLLLEGYYLYTKGGGFEDIPVNHMHSFGVMAIARYYTRWLKSADAFFDLGWGFVYNNITTRDLDSLFNSTPCAGLGIAKGKFDFTVRWYHQSNGGSRGNNQGTNQIQYLIGYRF
ncbi:MAG: acyloxyacyl hydrolase [Armatimonadetes bacterium]|nr:acyloxyacyl hydrolase [Armatimonadota bacterium]